MTNLGVTLSLFRKASQVAVAPPAARDIARLVKASGGLDLLPSLRMTHLGVLREDDSSQGRNKGVQEREHRYC